MWDPKETKNVVVFGGTGAQGKSVVTHLAATGLYNITVPTRDPTAPAAQALLTHPNTHLLHASYTTTAGLRAIFEHQDAAFISFNSFAIREPDELYWTIRAYEIAAASGVKHFVYSGAPNRLAAHGYDERFRNAHNAPTAQMAWTVVTRGVYIEMLGSLLRPVRAGDGTFVFAAPIGEGSVPLMPLDDYGALVKWVLRYPGESVGRRVAGAPFVTTWVELVGAFEEATGMQAVFRDVTKEEWFEGIKGYIDPEERMPRGVAEDDETATTLRKSFGAWWDLWKFNERDLEAEGRQRGSMEGVNPGRPKSVVDWMRRTGYDGGLKEALKMKKDEEA
ncbi:NAD(P)-binding protein [Mytilinidion resinicola]|uniref:NAD(P)-binding protein n=1 Tax=Mytilinidion resinicola TaxID=574789 RepID=A0A6A6YET4_9PEZI|nr:NAD(P)-binding protein [Mytilinidion resinicola]KAF2807119.1 NAD(P)-binding protein [Mytilinidion resinicola]